MGSLTKARNTIWGFARELATEAETPKEKAASRETDLPRLGAWLAANWNTYSHFAPIMVAAAFGTKDPIRDAGHYETTHWLNCPSTAVEFGKCRELLLILGKRGEQTQRTLRKNRFWAALIDRWDYFERLYVEGDNTRLSVEMAATLDRVPWNV